MLIGPVGLTLIYAIALTPLITIAASARTWQRQLPAHAWLVVGIAGWLMQVLLASYSLGVLFQEQGEILLAMASGVALHLCASDQAQKPIGARHVATPPRVG